MTDRAVLLPLREEATRRNAIVFIHGFGGTPATTWGDFPRYVMAEPCLDDWDVYSVGYSGSLAPDFIGRWAADPDIPKLAAYLDTRTRFGALEQYDGLAFVAHSLGGLVVQRALLDHPELLARTTHLVTLGTPSNGLDWSGLFARYKRPARDLDPAGPFISGLRGDWTRRWPKGPPFKFFAVAGDRDEFVPASSSLSPFASRHNAVVPGNHLDIVKPETQDSLCVRVVIGAIRGDAAPAGPLNAANVALEMLDFRDAVARLAPHADELDDANLVTLALALESLGEEAEALRLMERAGERGTDAKGVLAGRLKRRWVTEGRAQDFERALSLYESAYAECAANGNHGQALYHGINVCFLWAAARTHDQEIRERADEVLKHCDAAGDDIWSLGTRGEARLLLGDPAGALSAYTRAVGTTPAPKPWQLRTMHSQACQLSVVLGQDSVLERLDRIFHQEPV